MTEEVAKLNEQALVAIIAAMEHLEIDVSAVVDKGYELMKEPGSKILIVDDRRIDDVAMATALAMASAKGIRA
jgi:hypothetical protein